MADEVPELISELKKRTTLIQHLAAQIPAAKRTPEDLAELVTKIEVGARAKLADLRSALAEQRDLREVFLALFPDGLTFTPARTPEGERAVWHIEGAASFATVVGGGPLPIELRPRRDLTRSGVVSYKSSCWPTRRAAGARRSDGLQPLATKMAAVCYQIRIDLAATFYQVTSNPLIATS